MRGRLKSLDCPRRWSTRPLKLATTLQPQGLDEGMGGGGQTAEGASRAAGRGLEGKKEGDSPPDKRDEGAWGNRRGAGGAAKRSGLAGPTVTLIGAMATAALLKPRTPPSVHSRPPFTHPPAPAAAAAAHSATAGRETAEPALLPRMRSHASGMPGLETTIAPPLPRG